MIAVCSQYDRSDGTHNPNPKHLLLFMFYAACPSLCPSNPSPRRLGSGRRLQDNRKVHDNSRQLQTIETIKSSRLSKLKDLLSNLLSTPIKPLINPPGTYRSSYQTPCLMDSTPTQPSATPPTFPAGVARRVLINLRVTPHWGY